MDAFLSSVNGSHTDAPEVATPRDPFAGPLDSVAPWNYTLIACLMFAVTSLSLAENSTVMIVTYKFKQLRQPLNYIIVNLSVADFCLSLVGGTISFLTNARGYFFLGRWACVLEGFAVTFFGIVALWSLAILAFERFFVICRPLKNVRLGVKHAALGLLFVWTFSFVCTIPPVLGWNSYTVSKIGTTCEPNWYSRDYKDHTYIITFFVTCFILPLGVITVSYGKLMQKLRKVSNAHGKLGNARKPDQAVARMVIVMIIAYMVGWTPYAAFSILVTVDPTINIDPCLAAAPAFFAKTAAVYNPIIYVFMNKQFRKCLIQMFKGNGNSIDSSHLNPTSNKGPITQTECNLREMSSIATHVPMNMCNLEKTDEDEEQNQHENRGSTELPLSESRVCPL
ncbi:vertebrate ancient long opsin b [Ictalurus furcatus]|uniref:vertebrate ancient long opsin b n=1 Tax=Ictalurus furcatus TaxID=66913 RepID=UPI0023509ADF|nr:vertebrate ancient long opsin b [Ictalurus furcatus]